MAFETYKQIHDKWPDNIECLRYLVRICTDLGMKEVHDYINKLSRAEQSSTHTESNTEVGKTGLAKAVEKFDPKAERISMFCN